MSDFTPDSVAYGMRMNEFQDLPLSARRKLICLLARIAEASYRRGVHHGLHMAHEQRGYAADPEALRYERPLSVCPWVDRPIVQGSDVRLFTEHHVLNDIGFRKHEMLDLEKPDYTLDRHHHRKSQVFGSGWRCPASHFVKPKAEAERDET